MKQLDKIRASLYQNGVDSKMVKGKLQILKEDERQVEMFLLGFHWAPDLYEQIEFI